MCHNVFLLFIYLKCWHLISVFVSYKKQNKKTKNKWNFRAAGFKGSKMKWIETKEGIYFFKRLFRGVMLKLSRAETLKSQLTTTHHQFRKWTKISETHSSIYISPTFSSLLFWRSSNGKKLNISASLICTHKWEFISIFDFFFFFFLSVRVPASRFTLVCKCAGIG